MSPLIQREGRTGVSVGQGGETLSNGNQVTVVATTRTQTPTSPLVLSGSRRNYLTGKMTPSNFYYFKERIDKSLYDTYTPYKITNKNSGIYNMT